MNARPIVPWAFAIASSVSFVGGVIQCFLNSIGGATLLITAAFVSAILGYLPQLESIKAFSVDVRLRNSLDRADELIGRLRALSTTTAKANCLTIAWGNRLGSPSNMARRETVEAIIKQLEAIGVSAAERRSISRPIVHLAGFDLYHVYHRVLELLLDEKNRKTISELKHNGVDNPYEHITYKEFHSSFNVWRGINRDLIDTENSVFDLASALQAEIPRPLLSPDELRKATELSKRIMALHRACVREGNITWETAEYLDQHPYDTLDAYTKAVFRGDDSISEAV